MTDTSSSEKIPDAAKANDATPSGAEPSDAQVSGAKATDATPPSPKANPPKAAEPKGADAAEDGTDDSAKEAPSTVESAIDPEANEEKLFNEKAILYRFDKGAKDWKERGIGFMRILKNPETGRCRVLMRRAQTFRVCANHFVLPQMTLKANGDRALIWHATDFADGKESQDVLSVKFKSPEIVANFRAAFEKAKEQNKALGATGGEAAD
jgi:Ran-binding protein 1